MRRTACLLGILLLTSNAHAAVVSGTVTDEKNEPLSFASVYVEGTSRGTTTNTEGKYSLNFPAGATRLAYRLIGYKLQTISVTVAGDTVINVRLLPEAYNLKEVHVTANAEDPAYAIIRKAIGMRKHYLSQVQEFSCDAYTKFLQKMGSHPKKFLGQDVDLSEVLDTTSGILYLSESVSHLSYRYPDKAKEVMISSKVSGSNRSFSFNQAAGLLFNFYENLIDLGDIGQRGFVSPVASNALFYYRYKYEGEFRENGATVNKISVIPKRKHDPVFRGTIYIQDDTWRIHSLDLFITKESQLQIVDTVTFHQVYVPVDSVTWMPFSAQVDFVFSFLGFHGSGYFLGISSNYNIHPAFPPGYFSGEILKIERDANKKDSIYWQQARQVPLTLEERRDYVKKDSARTLHESKAFRDSVDRKNNRFKPGGLILGGYTYRRSYTKEMFSVSPLISSVQFNTVEGLNLDVGLSYSKGAEGDEDEEERKSYRINTHLRYGFSNSHFNAWAGYRKRYNSHTMGRYGIYAGTSVEQFNGEKPISELINTAYTLFSEHNYMKIYEKRFAQVFHESEILNGVLLHLQPEWQKRLPLVNTTDYTFSDKENRVFTSNDPQNPTSDANHFSEHEAMLVNATLTITPGQHYITRPDGKIPVGTDWPVFLVKYDGAYRVFGGDVSWNKLEASVSRDFGLGLFGHSSITLSGGGIPGKKPTEFIDYIHFNGNRTILSGFRKDDFKLLSYYTFSTINEWYAGNLEHSFGGFILNKIPLLRKLKLDEVVGVHYLHTKELGSYTELSIGVQKLGIFRIDFVTSFTDGTTPGYGVVFGIVGL